MIQLFNQGSFMEFFQFWDEHLSEEIRQNMEAQKLEFKLNVYFAVYPLLQRSSLGNQVRRYSKPHLANMAVRVLIAFSNFIRSIFDHFYMISFWIKVSTNAIPNRTTIVVLCRLFLSISILLQSMYVLHYTTVPQTTRTVFKDCTVCLDRTDWTVIPNYSPTKVITNDDNRLIAQWNTNYCHLALGHQR